MTVTAEPLFEYAGMVADLGFDGYDYKRRRNVRAVLVTDDGLAMWVALADGNRTPWFSEPYTVASGELAERLHLEQVMLTALTGALVSLDEASANQAARVIAAKGKPARSKKPTS